MEKVDNVDGSVFHEQRKREAKKVKDSFEKSEVLESWYTIHPDKQHKKGGKVILHQRGEMGVTTYYVGRERGKPEAVAFVDQIKKQGLLRTG